MDITLVYPDDRADVVLKAAAVPRRGDFIADHLNTARLVVERVTWRIFEKRSERWPHPCLHTTARPVVYLEMWKEGARP